MNAIFLGTSDEVSTCDCCGKSGLKRTVALERDGETVYFGTTCASRALGMPAKEVKHAAQTAQAGQVAMGRAFDDGMRSLEQAAADAAKAAFVEFVMSQPKGEPGCYADKLWKNFPSGYGEAKRAFAAQAQP